MGRAVSTRGICRICGCTDSATCPGGCYWVNDAHTLCSSCVALEARVKLDTNDRLALAWLNVLARGGRGVAWGGKGNVYAVITSILTRPAIVARKRA